MGHGATWRVNEAATGYEVNLRLRGRTQRQPKTMFDQGCARGLRIMGQQHRACRQRTLVRANGAVELHAEAPVDLLLALVVRPAHAELQHALRLHQARLHTQSELLRFALKLTHSCTGRDRPKCLEPVGNTLVWALNRGSKSSAVCKCLHSSRKCGRQCLKGDTKRTPRTMTGSISGCFSNTGSIVSSTCQK